MHRLFRASSAASGAGPIPITTGTTIVGSGAVTYPIPDLPQHGPADMKALENAVYGHISAVRALGRTQILASEIATSLSLPLADVVKALANLRSKGVKIGG
jgi:hypothetical protein